MKLLITGSHGFLGSHLMERLRLPGNELVVIPHAAIKDIDYLMDHYSKIDFDYIIHLAAYGNMHSQDNEFETIQANILNLFNLLNFSKHIPYKGFINVSSSSVMLPYETFYSATKGAGERIVKAFVNKYDKPVVNVRPFTIIGKGEQSDHLIPKLINSCIKGYQMPFVGDPVHDYVSVDDFCEALVVIMANSSKLKGQTVDIGTGIRTTNNEVLEAVKRVTGLNPNITKVDSMRKYDNADWRADKSVLYGLGWRQKQTVDDVIRGMI